MTGPRRFLFLNLEASLDEAEQDTGSLSRLWLYNLHYFDDLNARDAAARYDWHLALMRRWVREHPPGEGTGWEPYPCSLRIVNWIKWALAGNGLEAGLLQSLAVQARWLRGRLEIHLLGNHLWANAKALVFAGAFFEGPEARHWGEKGLALLARETGEQILPDGGHFERSPMYHAIVLEDILDLLQLATRFPGLLPPELLARWRSLVPAMLSWLRAMSHPDGGVAFFNDTTLGIAPDIAALSDYAARLGLEPEDVPPRPVEALDDSGYMRVGVGPALLIADVGLIGPDYLPGHAHADTLSFELSLYGRRFIVNSGIDRYGLDEERLRQRGTSSHSALEVDGRDSSEVWSGFRVARRARPHGLAIERAGERVLVRCSHDGYRRLPGKVTHTREWWLDSRSLTIEDELSGRFHHAVARLFLHPDVTVLRHDERHCSMILGEREVFLTVDGATLAVTRSTWHPGFGLSQLSHCMELTLREPRCRTILTWL